MWPDWAIYWSLGNFLKPLATIILPNFSTFLGLKIYHFSSEIILGNFIDIWRFVSGHTEFLSSINVKGLAAIYDSDVGKDKEGTDKDGPSLNCK